MLQAVHPCLQLPESRNGEHDLIEREQERERESEEIKQKEKGERMKPEFMTPGFPNAAASVSLHL